MTNRWFRPIVVVLLTLLNGCTDNPVEPAPPPGTVAPSAVTPPAAAPTVKRPDLLAFADLTGLTATPRTGDVELTTARNEWTSVLLQIVPPAPAAPNQAVVLKLPQLVVGDQKVDVSAFRVYQLVPVPIDTNRAGFVRHTGLSAGNESLPRALLPLTIDSGQIDLAQLRDPRKPAERANVLGANQPVQLWVDLRVPTQAQPGRYTGNFTLAVTQQPDPLATIKLTVQVNDFVLPDDRHLNMVGNIDWDVLKRHWPDRFEVIRPALFNRTSSNQRSAVKTLDELMKVAQEHRVQLQIPRLQPTVKWPSGQPVVIDWSDYDSIVAPWLTGEAFADKVPIGYWPMPRIEFLENIPAAARLEYYAAAAAHFDGRDWLSKAPVILSKATPGRANVAERLLLSTEASRIFSAHPRVRVMLPLELDEVQIAGAGNNTLISPVATSRLHCVAPGLISSSPLQKWPPDLQKPQNWLRTDLSGLIPYAGAGADESDVCVWSWMAFLRDATIINWEQCLPAAKTLAEPADPNELVWFYPGQWFGVDGIVPTIQLKWLRRAEQDYEYLYLARERGSQLSVLPMARVLTKPVEIRADQAPDPTFSLLVGTADSRAWTDARALLGRIIMQRGPGIEPNENAIADTNLQTLHWMEPLERPVILPRQTLWSVGNPPPGEIGPWVNLRLGIDIYNASDTTPDQNELQIVRPVAGWEVPPAPVAIPKLTMYQVTRQYLNARIDPSRARTARHAAAQVAYRSGFTGQTTPLDFVAPVTRAFRRTAPLTINGSLDDWVADDAIQLGPLVKMMSRPAVQKHTLEAASTPSEIYSGFSDSDFYIAFRVDGLAKSKSVLASRNFVDYQFRRAWGEDTCQLIAQAVYDDGTQGPLVHIAVKPGGNLWVERRTDPRLSVQPWQNFDAGVRYAATADQTIWRGELAIPWAALIAEEKTAAFAAQGKPNVPTLIKFNFIQQKRDTGESTSWAGPIDAGRDDSVTGVIVLKEPDQSPGPQPQATGQ